LRAVDTYIMRMDGFEEVSYLISLFSLVQVRIDMKKKRETIQEIVAFAKLESQSSIVFTFSTAVDYLCHAVCVRMEESAGACN
jgi:hypothetical protein